MLISESLRRLYGMVNEENDVKETVVQDGKTAVVIDLDEAQLRRVDEEMEATVAKKKLFAMPKGRKATMK